jgi:hypothetical protein
MHNLYFFDVIDANFVKIFLGRENSPKHPSGQTIRFKKGKFSNFVKFWPVRLVAQASGIEHQALSIEH